MTAAAEIGVEDQAVTPGRAELWEQFVYLMGHGWTLLPDDELGQIFDLIEALFPDGNDSEPLAVTVRVIDGDDGQSTLRMRLAELDPADS